MFNHSIFLQFAIVFICMPMFNQFYIIMLAWPLRKDDTHKSRSVNNSIFLMLSDKD